MVCGAHLLFLPAGVSVSHITAVRLVDGLKYVLDCKCSKEEIETSKESYRPKRILVERDYRHEHQ